MGLSCGKGWICGGRPAGYRCGALVLEVDEDAAEGLVVFLDAVVEGANVGLIEEAQHFLLELTAAFAGDDLDEADLLAHRFGDDAVELSVELAAVVVNVVQVEL